MLNQRERIEPLPYWGNPRRFSDDFDPQKDVVTLSNRPTLISSFFTETVFFKAGWHRDFAKRTDKFFYVEGSGAALRLFERSTARFLKEQGVIDTALMLPELIRGGVWAKQSGVAQDNTISANKISLGRAGEIQDGVALNFQVAVVFFIAIELALKESSIGISQYWPYEYMRIRPAVYNIKQFNEEKLKSLRSQITNFNVLAMAECEQDSAEFLDELSMGCTATYKTVFLLQSFINRVAKNEALKVQEIVSGLGVKRLKKQKICGSETV